MRTRFTLRSCLLLTVAACVVFAVVRQVPYLLGWEDAAILRKLVSEAGGELSAQKGFYDVSLQGKTVSVELARKLGRFPELVSLDLADATLCPECLQQIAQNKDIHYLSIRNVTLRSVDYLPLATMNVSSLNIAGCAISDEALLQIMEPQIIGSIILDRRRFSDATLRRLLSRQKYLTIVDGASFEMIKFE